MLVMEARRDRYRSSSVGDVPLKPMKLRTFRCSDELWARLAVAAVQNDRRIGEAIRDAVTAYVEKAERAAKRMPKDDQ